MLPRDWTSALRDGQSNAGRITRITGRAALYHETSREGDAGKARGDFPNLETWREEERYKRHRGVSYVWEADSATPWQEGHQGVSVVPALLVATLIHRKGKYHDSMLSFRLPGTA